MTNYLDSKLRRFAWWRKWRGLPEPMSAEMQQLTRAALNILNNCSLSEASVFREYPVETGGTIRIKRPQRFTQRSV